MKRILIAIISLAFFNATLAAEDASALLKSELTKIKSFSAQFEQQIIDSNKRITSQSKGSLLIKRPGAFYWNSQEPDPIIVVADGKTLWTYDIDLEQVTKQSMAQALDKTPAALLAGELKDLDRDFRISTVSKNKCVQGADSCFHLVSRNEEKDFSDLYISMRESVFIALTVHDQLGQKIITQFKNIGVNEPVDESKFKFTPPKGVDVIDQHKGK